MALSSAAVMFRRRVFPVQGRGNYFTFLFPNMILLSYLFSGVIYSSNKCIQSKIDIGFFFFLYRQESVYMCSSVFDNTVFSTDLKLAINFSISGMRVANDQVFWISGGNSWGNVEQAKHWRTLYLNTPKKTSDLSKSHNPPFFI